MQCIPLSKQVDYYSNVYKTLVQELGSDAAQQHLLKSLFFIMIGSNDIFGYFEANSSIYMNITPQNYVDSMVSTLKGVLKVRTNPEQKNYTYKYTIIVDDKFNFFLIFND